MLLDRAPRLGRVRLGVVDGPSGSGKSTFAAAWGAALHDAGTVDGRAELPPGQAAKPDGT